MIAAVCNAHYLKPVILGQVLLESLKEEYRPCIVYLDPLVQANRSFGKILRLLLELALFYELGPEVYRCLLQRHGAGDSAKLVTEANLPDFQAIVSFN